MRKNIGWQEKGEDVKYRIRVIFDGGDRLLWRRLPHRSEGWESFEPTPEHWRTLLEKAKARYVRRQAPYKDLQLIARLAARHPAPPDP